MALISGKLSSVVELYKGFERSVLPGRYSVDGRYSVTYFLRNVSAGIAGCGCSQGH